MCDLPAQRDWDPPKDVYFFRCRSCGVFWMTPEAGQVLRSIDEQRYKVSAFTREETLRDRIPILTSERVSMDGVHPGDPLNKANPIQIEEVIATRYPRTINERLDRSLANLAHMSRHLGDSVAMDLKQDAPLFFAANVGELRFTRDALVDDGLVAIESSHSAPDGWVILLTPAGWNRVADIEAGRSQEETSQAFVAMWFGNNKDSFEGRTSFEFCSGAFMQGFKPGIENAGYLALRIDCKEFNDDINDEIIAEIRRSKFVVADFTGNRGGVYFEAGFARGLERPVIFTCHKSDIDKAHFDTNHYKHIVWTSFDELADCLEKRIVATMGQGPSSTPRI